MSNKRVKSMAVDDDDYYEDDYADEYQEDGELSAEDREQLRLATIKVRQQLGSTYNIPEKAIHDALWNYYYDVGKTISYLKGETPGVFYSCETVQLTFQDNHKPLPGKSTPAAPNKAKSEGALLPLFPFLNSISFRPITSLHFMYTGCPQLSILPNVITGSRDSEANIVAPGLFADAPWLNVPAHRQALIIEEPMYARGRLLGGAPGDGKVSKLAALAAKRRQAQTTKPAAADNGSSNDAYTDRLKHLTITRSNSDPKQKESQSIVGEQDQVVEVDGKDEQRKETSIPRPRLPEAADVRRLQQPPSVFASIITADRVPSSSDVQETLLPVDNDKEAPASFDFSSPSPDDVFTRAQAKVPKR